MNQNQEKNCLSDIVNHINEGKRLITCSGLIGSERAYLIAGLHIALKIPVFVITESQKQAGVFIDDLLFFLKNRSAVSYFPQRGILPFKSSSPNETAAERIRILYQMAVGNMPPVLVTTIEACMQKIICRRKICDYAELIMAGEEIDRDMLIQKLISGGYSRSAIVEEPGDFSIRGGILDIFSPLYNEPLRVEFSGDMVESLRFFSAETQRTRSPIQEAVILPAREVVIIKEESDRLINRIREQASELEISTEQVRELVEAIKEKNGAFSGLESLMPLIWSDSETIFDYASPDKYAVCSMQYSDFFHRLPAACCLIFTDHYSLTTDHYSLTTFFSVQANTGIQEEIKNCRENDTLLQPLAEWISDKIQLKYAVILVCSTPSQAERLTSLLAPYGISPRMIDTILNIRRGAGIVWICVDTLSSGFVWHDESLAIITDAEIFGPGRRRKHRAERKIQTDFFNLDDLKKGDLIVHISHGIGQYEGLIKLKLEDMTGDFLMITYKDGDKLYVPVERMDMVQKYIGVDGITPELDKMGGKSWDRVKMKAKQSAEKIAGDLLNIYAQRKTQKGHSFEDPGPYFRDFEAGFPYAETPDQIKAIEDVLNDMAEPAPMDRLVCGDVGYGKTEIALRASFVAVHAGKQVAVLVPTTVLAEQHYATFRARFEKYPINISCLSRFRSAREQRAILDDLKAGKTDIIIGTHRLLQKDVEFKELGLFVLDEEQRFGVKHKEKLKKLRATVDVLALTATPIPRTLHMSLMGIRDISIISTPPEHRHPIITYISTYDDAIAAQAIRNELERNGQIFFVHNDIHNIWAVAKRLQEQVPEVRLDVGHGRMDEADLERVMLKFAKKEIDMLVCTTIIESGLDIPSANTILINRADRFGLSQMYQLRGRVGRGEDQAYAYLFIPNENALTPEAKKRLKVLMEHSDLGSGFQIAMSDLKIRGGGTILGVSQSGHVAAVGYEMFLTLMENAVSEMRGETVQEMLEPEINAPMSAFIPESYIPDIDQRLLAYRRLSRMKELKDIPDFKAELIDRYGELPAEGANLLLKIMLKILCVKSGVKRLDITENRLILHFSKDHLKNPASIIDMVLAAKDRFELTPDHVLNVRLAKGEKPLVQAKRVLKELIIDN